METLKGILLQEFPYSNLIKVEDIIYYDGPLLSHYIDEHKNNYLYYWLDNNDDFNRWLIILVNHDHLYEYLNGQRNLRSIFIQDYNKTAITIDIDDNVVKQNCLFIKMPDLPEDLLPQENSFYTFSVPDSYQSFFEETSSEKDYLNIMREKSVFFRLESLATAFGKTLTTNDVTNFLQKFNRSFSSYVEARFIDLYKSKYKTQQALENALNSFLELVNTRVVNLSYKSFGVDLASDVLDRRTLTNDVSEWQKTLLEEYKKDVIDFDFSSTSKLAENLEGLAPEQLRAIFLPIIQLSNNPNFIVQVSDERKGGIKKLKQVPKKTEEALFPKPKIENVPPEMEFTNLVLELEKGLDITSLTKTKIMNALLSMERNTHTTLRLDSINGDDGDTIHLQIPIEFTLSVSGQFYETTYEPLDIKQIAVSRQLAIEEFKNTVSRIYKTLIVNQPEINTQSERQKRLIQHLKELVG